MLPKWIKKKSLCEGYDKPSGKFETDSRLITSVSVAWLWLQLLHLQSTLTLHLSSCFASVLCQHRKKCLLQAVLGAWNGNTVSKTEKPEWYSKCEPQLGVIPPLHRLWSRRPHEASQLIGWDKKGQSFSKVNRWEDGVLPASEQKRQSLFPLELSALWDDPTEFCSQGGRLSINDATSVLLCRKHRGAQSDR